MKYRLLVAVAVAAFLFGATAYAHHSFAAVYNVKETIKLEGNLVQFVFRNPHSFVSIEAPDSEGKMQRWSLEWSGVGQLANQGVTRETLKPGDQIVVVGNPSRVPGEYKALMVNLKRPSDGFAWGGRGGETVD